MRAKGSSRSYGQASPGSMHMAAILERCGIVLPPGGLDRLWTYHQLLRKYNPELNLTRIHNFDNMVLKLYVDSILPGKLVELPSPLLDLGTGPGMPGIPLKIAYPQLEILLAESRQKRVAFLNATVDRLELEGVRVIGEGITPNFQNPVAGVITRAVENIGATLDRIRGCLARDGLAILMKGPHCDEEIQAAVQRFEHEYRLIEDRPYRIPHTSHERRLVVFQRLDVPAWAMRAEAMKRHSTRKIESEQNDIFKDLKKLLSSRGIRKQQRALVSGAKQTAEILQQFPERCMAWISSGEGNPPPSESPPHLAWYQFTEPLFRVLDLFGTGAPLLLIRTQEIQAWDPSGELPEGCSVLIPFQDPENVGAVIRSAVAFGVMQIILLSESAHPYHPKALRASGGTVLHAKLLQGPSIEDLPEEMPLVALSTRGRDIAEFVFPSRFVLLPGMEGPGLPERMERHAVSIPIVPRVESLNAATATAVALYVLWSRRADAAKEQLPR